MSIREGAARSLTLLTLKPNDRLDRRAIVDGALRAAVLVDVVLERGTVGGTGPTLVDCSPTGFPPADLLLGEIEEHPNKPLRHWILRGPSLHRALAQELVTANLWRPRRTLLGSSGFEAGQPASDAVATLRAELRTLPDTSTMTADHASALALAKIAGMAGTYAGRPDELIGACGPADWIVSEFDAARPRYVHLSANARVSW